MSTQCPKLKQVADQYYVTTNTPVQIRVYKSEDKWHGVYKIDSATAPVRVQYSTRKRAVLACMRHLRDDHVDMSGFETYLDR